MVVRNRLEQLRKRQRDEAAKAQRELLGGTKPPIPDAWVNEAREAVQKPAVVDEDEDALEEYERDMSPELLDPKKLSYEDRQLSVVDPHVDLQALVSLLCIQSRFRPLILAFQVRSPTNGCWFSFRT